MADDRARKLAESALTRLAAELQTGKSEALQNYLATMGRFHRYSWGNVLLIASQKPTASRVAGIYTWNKLGRIVNEGEKGIMILAPVLKKEREENRNPPIPGNSAPNRDGAPRLVGFRTAFVYDVGQTHGKSLPEFAKTTGDPKDYADKLKAFVFKQGISLEYDKWVAPAHGISSGGKIRLMPNMHPAEEFSVLAHELAHEMLHHANGQERLPKTLVETQAEAVAYVVCGGVGLETNSASADYIHLYNGDKKTLAESLSVIQETSSKILDQLLPEQHRSPFQEKPGRSRGDIPRQSHGEADHAHTASSTPPAEAPDRSESVSMER